MLVKYLAMKLFYCAYMFMFISSFQNYAKITVKRVIKYLLLGVIYYPVLLYIPITWEYRIMLMFALITFFSFEGSIIEKISINTLAEATWCALGLVSKLAFGDIVSALVPSEASQEIMFDLTCLVLLSCSIRFLDKAKVFDQDIVKQRVTSTKQQIGMIILAVEGDIVLWIAEMVYDTNTVLIVNVQFTGFVLCIAGLYLVCFALSLDNTIAKEHYKVENKTLESQIKSQYSYYEKLDRVTKETRAIKHDMKNHLIVIRGLVEKGEMEEVKEYLDSIQSKMDNVSVVIYTGNSIVDSIVNEKMEIAKTKNIEMIVDMALDKQIKVSAMDLCVMVANSLDNAIEACDKMPPESKKQIKIYGRCQHGYLSFTISNTVAKNVFINNNTVVTDKLDKLNHGFGLQNIKNSVKRNNGQMKIECIDQIFALYIDIKL